MTRMPVRSDGLSPARRRRLVQLVFIFVNLALVEAHLPGPLWLAIGGVFWIALIGITLGGSGLVCGSMCWIGAIQDIFEPFARPRLRIDGRYGRAFVLALVLLWMPIGWLVVPGLAAHDRMPLDFSLAWERHLFQLVLAAGVASSVLVLGKRGLCRYLCPFNSIVATVRRTLAKGFVKTAGPGTSSIQHIACASACVGCSRHDDMTATSPYERSSV